MHSYTNTNQVWIEFSFSTAYYYCKIREKEEKEKENNKMGEPEKIWSLDVLSPTVSEWPNISINRNKRCGRLVTPCPLQSFAQKKTTNRPIAMLIITSVLFNFSHLLLIPSSPLAAGRHHRRSYTNPERRIWCWSDSRGEGGLGLASDFSFKCRGCRHSIFISSVC